MPEIPPPAAIELPAFEERVLANGASLVVVPDSTLPWVTVSLIVTGGMSADPLDRVGVSTLVASLLTRGTDRLGAAELSEAVDALGATLTATAGTDWTTVVLGVLTPHLDAALGLMAEVVMSPSFSQEELQRVRRRALVSLQAGWADPRIVASRTLRERLYGAHPYGWHQDPDRLRGVTLADLRDYHGRSFRPEGAMFLVSGDVDPDAAAGLLDAHFGDWASASDALPPPPEPAQAGSGGIVLVHLPGSTRAIVRVGQLLPRGDDPDWVGLSMASQLLGGGGQDRLTRRFAARGWAGSVFSSANRRRGPGFLEVGADVRVELADSAISEIMGALEELSRGVPEPAEVESLRAFTAASLPLRFETARQVAAQIGSFRMLGLGSEALGAWGARIRDVTPEELASVAAERIRPQDATTVVVGDASLLRPRLAALGPLSIVDVDGRPLDLADLAPPVTPFHPDASPLREATWTYRISADGSVVGDLVRSLTRDVDGTPGRLTLTSTTTTGPQVLVQEVTFDGEAFRAVRGSFDLTLGDRRAGARLEVRDQRVVGSRTLPDGRSEPFEAPFGEGALIGEMLEVAIWLAELREGLELVLPIVQVESGAQARVRVRVLDRVRITVPAGRFDTYRVEIGGGQASQVVFARVTAPHVIVRLQTEGQPFVMELESETVGPGG